MILLLSLLLALQKEVHILSSQVVMMMKLQFYLNI